MMKAETVIISYGPFYETLTHLCVKQNFESGG